MRRPRQREPAAAPLGAAQDAGEGTDFNAAARRSYEKVGFRALRVVHVPGEPDPEFLMRVTAADLNSLQA